MYVIFPPSNLQDLKVYKVKKQVLFGSQVIVVVSLFAVNFK
jgi:hypothetical protein